MIKLSKVSKIYYNNGVIGTGFSKVSAEFKMGEFVVIVGESGSGKSTLLNVISGLDTYEEGEMYINGEETSHYSKEDFEEYRRKYVANIFQAFNLVNSYTVRQNVELVLLINGNDKKFCQKRVDDILKRVGLWDLRNKRISKLSGGQKQRVAIARALAKETPIIVADEPTGNLDQESAKQIFELLHEISKDKLVVVVTHNFEQVSKYATRVIRMHDGKIVEDKKLKDINEVEPKVVTHKKMSLASKFLLAFRNSFNVVPKFLLILGVFIMVSISLLGQYSSYKSQEYETFSKDAYFVFNDKSPERVIVNKKDKSIITEDELKRISEINHVSKYIKNDYLLDVVASVEFDNDSSTGLLASIDDFNGKLVEGRMPENKYEILYVTSKDNSYLLSFKEDWFNVPGHFSTNSYDTYNLNEEVKIVGIALDDRSEFEESTLYMNNETLDYALKFYMSNLFKFKYVLPNGVSTSDDIGNNFVISNEVPKGEVFYNEGYNSFCENQDCTDQNLTIEVKSIYTTNTLELKITKSYNEITSKNYNSKGYSLYNQFLISPEDYNSLIKNDNYQVSIYVDNVENIEEVTSNLNELGYNTYAVKDTNMATNEILAIFEYINYVLLALVFIVLFAVSYFIINLVLNSRVTYFAVVRMLGGNSKLNKQLINLELFINATVSFVCTLGLMILCKYHLIEIDALNNALRFLHVIHFVFVYIILILLSQLIAWRFSRKIFKDSMITTYNMEV